MISDWPIRVKLGVGFGALIAICLALGLFAMQAGSHFEQMLVDLHDESLVPVIELSEVRNLAMWHNRELYSLLLEPDPEERQRIHKRMADSIPQLQNILAAHRHDGASALEKSQMGVFARSWADYLRTVDEVLARHGQEGNATALRLVNRIVTPAFFKTEEELDYLIELHTTTAHELMDNKQAVADRFLARLETIMLLSLLAGVILTLVCARAIVRPIRLAADINSRLANQSINQIELIEAIADGDLQHVVPDPEKLRIPDNLVHSDETGELLRAARRMGEGQATLTRAMRKMVTILAGTREAEQRQDWIKTGLNESNALLRGDKGANQMVNDLLPFLVSYLHAAAGALYLFDEQSESLTLAATWSLPKDFLPKSHFALGEGILGQAACERRRITLDEIPNTFLPVISSFGTASTCVLTAQPLVHDDELYGVIELGYLHPLHADESELLEEIAGNLALTLKIIRSRTQIADLLEQEQQHAEELRVQQEELQQSNEELEERAQLLELQREQIVAKNREVELATEELRRKAEELARISAYKSEFLANMSHELRSPLNSLLILSGLLQENRDGNLSEKEIQFATTIHSAGNDLLTLINDILDLSKVEAGRLDLHAEPVLLRELADSLRFLFQPQAEAKRLAFRVDFAKGAPEQIEVDQLRLQQILRNLLSNACKFTEQGEIALVIRGLHPGEAGIPGNGVAFEVRDTGIGVEPDKKQLIFEAFQQADGSTSRKYGGTGLGLAIARQLSQRMGGGLLLDSTPGVGSVFTLCLPAVAAVAPPVEIDSAASASALPAVPRPDSDREGETLPQPVPDDRALVTTGTRTILVVEDDLRFAQILVEMVRGRHFAALVATDGETGIAMADRYQPSAILLDVMLPHIDGWAVMRHLKDNPRTRHIPVHFISCLNEEHKALAMGAVGYIRKPVTSEQLDAALTTVEHAIDQTVKHLLVVEDNEREAAAMVELLGERNVEITVAASGREAIERLGAERYDCIVIDLGLADMSGFTLLEHIHEREELNKIPVVIHSGRELDREDEQRLRRYAESIIIKGAQSPDRLLNEVTLFLHLVESGLTPNKQKMIRLALDQEAMLAGKKILIVDDDMRNIFSLSSILSQKQIEIHEAENGREALQQLAAHPDMDLVLMDIMMPEMDGYETMQAIRQDQRFNRLPIIAMTAKALKGDQEKCLDAGASDYLSKPIDPVKLFSLLRVWLYRDESRL